MEAPNLVLPNNFITPKPVLVTLFYYFSFFKKKVTLVILIIFESNFSPFSLSEMETPYEMLGLGLIGGWIM